QVRLDGQPMGTPLSFDAVVGITRNLSPQSPQTLNGETYEFVSWSDGGSATHDISTPGGNTTYTATYRQVTTNSPPPPPTLSATASGMNMTIAWTASAGATSYRVQTGSVSGGSDLLNTDVGNITSASGVVPPGVYYVRVHAVSPRGTSAASNEVRVQI